MKKKKSKADEIKHEEEYVEFLKKALGSKNFQENDPERYEKTKVKYERAKFRLKTLKMN